MTAFSCADDVLLRPKPALLAFAAAVVWCAASAATESPPAWTVLAWILAIFAWHPAWPTGIRRFAAGCLCIALFAPAAIRPGGLDSELWQVWIPGWMIAGLCWAIRQQTTAARREPDDSRSRDELTEVLTRGSILQALRDRIRSDQFESGTSVLAFLDCDDLKSLNDRLGHVAGDRLLRTVAQTIRGCLRSSDLVGRYGGDEFLVVLDCIRAAQAESVMRRVQQQVARATARDGHPLTVSIGMTSIVTGPESDASALEELIERADRLMYRAKSSGAGQLVCDFADGSRDANVDEEF